MLGNGVAPRFRGHRGLSWALGALLPLGALAEDGPRNPVVTLRIGSHSGFVRGPVSVEAIRLAFVGRGTSDEATKSITLSVLREEAISLPMGVWSFRPTASGYWGPEKVVDLARTRDVTLELWPTGEIAGQFRGSLPPASLRADFEPASPAGDPSGWVACEVQGAQWTCQVPEGPLHVALRSRGFTGHYAWRVGVRRTATTTLGAIELRPEASVVGRVRHKDGLAANCRVTITSYDGKPLDGHGFSASTNDYGFFQMIDVPPGQYVLVAEQTGWAKAREPIVVWQRTETTVNTLRLDRPHSLEIVVDPPLHPGGERWAIQVLGAAPVPGGVEVASDSLATERGVFRQDGLSPGPYQVTVGAQGQNWASEEVDVPTAGPVHLRVPLGRLHGTVALGGEPLRTQVIFGGSHGAVRVAFDSDDEGVFEGPFPAGPEAWDVEIRGEDPPVRRTLHGIRPTPAGDGDFEVAIKLPGTRLTGTVVDEYQQPVERAIVNFQSASAPEKLVQTATDEHGRFELRALPVGRAHLTALGLAGQSAQEEIELRDTKPTDVLLVLGSHSLLKGRVVSADGEPIAAATIVAAPVGQALWINVPFTSDRDGYFEARLPKQAQEVALSVGAKGYAFRNLRVAVQPELEIVLDRLAGTIVLELDPGLGESAASPREYLVHDGSYEPVGFLRGWGMVNAEPDEGPHPAEANLLTLPQMRIGDYWLCVSTIPESWQLAVQGPSPDCANGELRVGETLFLRSPTLSQRSRRR